MDKDRIEGAGKQAKGSVKEAGARSPAMPRPKPKARPTRPKDACRTRLAG